MRGADAVKKWHVPQRDFLKAANSIARSTIKPTRLKVLLFLLSHEDGFRIMKSSAATTLGLSRPAVDAAIKGLESEDRLLIRQPVIGPSGKQVGVTYHASHTPFSAAEAAELSLAVQVGRVNETVATCKRGLHECVNEPYALEDHPEDQEQLATPGVLPEDWAPGEQLQRLASELGVNLAEFTAKFRDKTRGETSLDWNHRYQQWLMREKASRPRAGATTSGVSQDGRRWQE